MFMPTLRTAVRRTAVHPAAQRYYIMGAESLPTGATFALRDSHRHLLTEFAMGDLTVADVVARLAASIPAPPPEAAPAV